MTKTTPEEAIELAKKHGAIVSPAFCFGEFTLTPESLAALIDEVRAGVVAGEPVELLSGMTNIDDPAVNELAERLVYTRKEAQRAMAAVDAVRSAHPPIPVRAPQEVTDAEVFKAVATMAAPGNIRDANHRMRHVLEGFAASRLVTGALPAMTGKELNLLRQTIEGFADCGETETDYSVLIDWARRGLLECTNFQPTAAAHRILAATPPSAAPAGPTPVLKKFNELIGNDQESPLERLRFFCSLAMSGQDWLDVKPFFAALEPGDAQGDEELSIYLTQNYPDAKGETATDRAIAALEKMDAALGYKSNLEKKYEL